MCTTIVLYCTHGIYFCYYRRYLYYGSVTFCLRRMAKRLEPGVEKNALTGPGKIKFSGPRVKKKKKNSNLENATRPISLFVE